MLKGILSTCLASDQSVRGQPDLGEVAFADAPVDGIEPDSVRFAVHRRVSPAVGGVVPQCSYAALLRATAIERPVAAAIRDANDAALLLPPMLRRQPDAVRMTAVVIIIRYCNIVVIVGTACSRV